jgi:hypothetical protein
MYEQIWLAVVILVLALTMRRLMKVDGLAILAYVWLYSLGRFFITFYRANDPMLGGLKEAQLIALAALVLAPVVAYWLVRRQRTRKPDPSGALKSSSDGADRAMVLERRAIGSRSNAHKTGPTGSQHDKGKMRKFRVQGRPSNRFTPRRPRRAK